MGYKVNKIMLGTQQVRPSGWTPNANTLLYLPLQSDVVDKSGKTGRTFTTSGISYTTVGGVQSIHVGSTGGIYLTAPYPIITSSVAKKQTISVLYYVTSQTSSTRRILVEFAVNNYEYFALILKENTTNIQFSDGSSAGWVGSGTTIIANQWNNVILTGDTNTRNIYINGSLAWSASAGTNNPPRGKFTDNYNESAQGILTVRGGGYNQSLNGNARELIIEDKMWSADDVSKYYNWIKDKLGF